jgi:DNA-binding MurR/RpiR family transcriptional regulator
VHENFGLALLKPGQLRRKASPVAVALLLPERIRLFGARLTAGQRQVARFCLTQPEQAGQLTAARIGRSVGVSESTVVRLATALGYDGFPELQGAIRETLKHSPALRMPDGQPPTPELRASLVLDQRNLAETIAQISPPDLHRTVELLATAPQVFVLGFRTSFSLAYLAAFLIRQVRGGVRLMGELTGTYPDDLAELRPGDVLFAFSFPRYVGRTVQAVEYARSHGIVTVSLTDSLLSPIAQADVVLTVRHDSLAFFNSNVAATAVINSLVVELTRRVGGDSPEFRRRLVEVFYEWTQAGRSPREDST